MRILLSFQLWLLPLLDEKKSRGGRWGLESLLQLRVTGCPWVRKKPELQSDWGNGASDGALTNAHALFFSVISTWPSRQRKKKKLHMTRIGLDYNTVVFKVGYRAPPGPLKWILDVPDMKKNDLTSIHLHKPTKSEVARVLWYFDFS